MKPWKKGKELPFCVSGSEPLTDDTSNEHRFTGIVRHGAEAEDS